MFRTLCLLSIGAMSSPVLAQEGGPDGEGPGGPPRWSLGVAAMLTDSPYAGEGTRVMPIPLVSYQGERFSFKGITAGFRLFGSESLELSAIGKFRFDGFDVKDLGRRELAANGIDYRLLEDRDLGFDAGLGMTWRGAAGELEVELLADATDTSGGQEASVQYGYPIPLGNGRLTPAVGVTWLSKDMANYYYGTLDEEIARGVIAYRPGSATIPHVGLSYFRPLGTRWSMMASFKYSSLPDEITDSPLVERDSDGSGSVFVGFSRGF
ncbi:MipA/OmpV family protein [Dokdonella sp. MW10]|uniref:MipA/OmpV family protein n=1 Tax=Dokdonella sp. MW10 TaxID=2992926 RepID=UPI003F7EAA05